MIACGMERCDPGVNYGPDMRDGYHLHVILSGTGTLCVKEQTFHPHFGQMFLLKDGEKVQYTADKADPWEYCWVTYNGTEARRLSEQIGFTGEIYCLDSAVEAKEFYELICRMHEKPEMNYINDLRRRGILLEFLALALESAEPKSRKKYRYEYSPETYINCALEFIRYNYATIKVSDIVAYIGFTRSYFTTVFKKQVGLSPQEYLMQYRLKEAVRRLLETLEDQGQSGPGCFNDMDMLVVGMYNGGVNPETAFGGCSDEEYQTHFVLWAMMGSPLMIGCDIRSMSCKTREMLTNQDVIALNQDPECRGCHKVPVYGNPDAFVLIKPLAGGEYGIGFFNFSDVSAKVTLDFWDIGLSDRFGYDLHFYDCLSHKDIGRQREAFSPNVAAHGCKVYRCRIRKKKGGRPVDPT